MAYWYDWIYTATHDVNDPPGLDDDYTVDFGGTSAATPRVAAIDQGEVWDLRVELRNDGEDLAVGTSARLVAGPGNPGAVSDVADDKPNFRMRWMILSDANYVTSGWNIDKVEVSGIPYDSCQNVPRPLSGVSSDLTVTLGPPGELQLNWQAGCGGGTSYGVYRGDLALAYDSLAAQDGHCAIPGLSATLPEGTGQADFFLVVPNDGVFDGSYGADSLGKARSPAAQACYPQDTVDACAE